MLILKNDQFLKREDAVVDVEDRGYQFGDGVYEVIRVYDGKLFEMDAHMRRLERSLSAIRIPFKTPIPELEHQLLELCRLNQLENGMIYMQITRGTSERTHAFPKNAEPVLVAYTKSLERPIKEIQEGVKVCLTEDIRWLRCSIKSLNLLPNSLAKQEAVEKGCQEAVLHRGDTVTEGSSSNIFIVKGKTLFTHPANNLILNGITRLWVIRNAVSLGFTVVEKHFTKDNLLQADEAFITSTIQEIMPVIKVEDHLIGSGVPGEITQKLQALFQQEIGSLSYKIS
ncbi:D-amino-acid transaminase [Pullulanibacillus sp. KACC 23026]|uniref:D-amino-acid transaminase n=1 Tax=Pullulanibacillus sp. KACC 23026 TaxID=3028315 RepID=UPI0031B56DA4